MITVNNEGSADEWLLGNNEGMLRQGSLVTMKADQNDASNNDCWAMITVWRNDDNRNIDRIITWLQWRMIKAMLLRMIVEQRRMDIIAMIT